MEKNNIDEVMNCLLSEELGMYMNKSATELKTLLNITTSAKNVNSIIINSLLRESKQFTKIKKMLTDCNYLIKTINLEWNNNLKESMSLKAFKYNEIVYEDWETSNLRNFFLNTNFIFIIFKKDYKDTFLNGFQTWKMPIGILDGDVKKTWLNTKNLIKNGEIVDYIDRRGRYITNFLSCSATKFIHVRPHAQTLKDTNPLPTPDKFTGLTEFSKHSFMINNNYIKKIISEGKTYESFFL